MTKKCSFNSEKSIWQKVKKNQAILDLISGKKIGHQAVSPTILRFFFYYLIPKINYVLVRSATREATSILCLLHQILTAAQHSGKQNFKTHGRLPKHFGQDCLKIFHLHFASLLMTPISQDCSILARKRNIYIKKTYQLQLKAF